MFQLSLNVPDYAQELRVLFLKDPRSYWGCQLVYSKGGQQHHPCLPLGRVFLHSALSLTAYTHVCSVPGGIWGFNSLTGITAGGSCNAKRDGSLLDSTAGQPYCLWHIFEIINQGGYFINVWKTPDLKKNYLGIIIFQKYLFYHIPQWL